MPHPFCVERLTVSAMDPVEHVTLAAELGCPTVSLALEHGTGGNWTLREDAALRRRLAAALAERGVTIAVGEGFVLSASADAAGHAADLDLFAQLGARRISGAESGLERPRAFDQLALLCEMAGERGMDFAVEFGPSSAVRNLATAREALRHIGEGRAGLLIDSLRFFRAGGTIREIAELDPALIEHVRLSDARRKGPADFTQEERGGRLIPGEGELPLREFVEVLPRGQRLGIAASPDPAGEGRSAHEFLIEALMKTRSLLV